MQKQINYKGREIEICSKAHSDRVYDDINTKQSVIAQATGRIYIENFESKISFYGDTYNQKEEIKQLAEKYAVKAKFEKRAGKYNSFWAIDTDDIASDTDYVDFLKEILEKYDYSYKTKKRLEGDIDYMINN